MQKIDIHHYNRLVFFTGAGMSAESGVPTYRGRGGIWRRYNWEEYACQEAFDRDPEKVLKFHELRRESVLQCNPHAGHGIITQIEKEHHHTTIITQNIDGLHQKAGSHHIIELHGSLWRLRCSTCKNKIEDFGQKFGNYRCRCGSWLRPDITWFGDYLDETVMEKATQAVGTCDLFISIGTSGVVWPAAGFPQLAKSKGATGIEINPEPSELSYLYDRVIRGKAGEVLPKVVNLDYSPQSRKDRRDV